MRTPPLSRLRSLRGVAVASRQPKQLAKETVLEATVGLIVASHCFVWRAGPLRLRDDSSCEGMPECPEREIAWSPMQKPVDVGCL
jgi:hypothetical protein